jgi:hypothetical protein
MALTHCTQCGGQISDHSATCLHCGARRTRRLPGERLAQTPRGRICELAGAGLIVAGMVAVIMNIHLLGATLLVVGFAIVVAGRYL